VGGGKKQWKKKKRQKKKKSQNVAKKAKGDDIRRWKGDMIHSFDDYYGKPDEINGYIISIAVNFPIR